MTAIWASEAVKRAPAAMFGIPGIGVCHESVIVHFGGLNGGSKGLGAARYSCCAAIIYSALGLFIERTEGRGNGGATHMRYRVGCWWDSSQNTRHYRPRTGSNQIPLWGDFWKSTHSFGDRSEEARTIMCTFDNLDKRLQHIPRICYPRLWANDGRLALGSGDENQDRGKCTRCQQHRSSGETPGEALDDCTVPKDRSPTEELFIPLQCSDARRQDEVESRAT